ncbi:MAG TPA: hypothetical protein VK736_02200 [Candidatus Binatia bacterium]|nr:hypothetical protein [Candidatus Binatia bacterium]
METNAEVASVVVRPRRPMFTPLGTWVVRLSLPWLLLSSLGMDAAFAAMGLPSGERPLALRLSIAAVAVALVALVLFSPLLVRVPGFDWLFLRPQPIAIVDPTELALRLPGIGERRFRWEEVGSLRFKGRWDGGSDLRSPGGLLLAEVPDEIVHPKVYWFSADTLAESVVQARPDRFALAHGRSSLGRPASFDLRERVGSGVDLVAWKRRRDAILLPILGGVVLLGVVGIVLLLTR